MDPTPLSFKTSVGGGGAAGGVAYKDQARLPPPPPTGLGSRPPPKKFLGPPLHFFSGVPPEGRGGMGKTLCKNFSGPPKLKFLDFFIAHVGIKKVQGGYSFIHSFKVFIHIFADMGGIGV